MWLLPHFLPLWLVISPLSFKSSRFASSGVSSVVCTRTFTGPTRRRSSRAVGQPCSRDRRRSNRVPSNQKYNTMFNFCNSIVSHCKQLTVIMVVVTSLRMYVRVRGNVCCLVVLVSLQTNKQCSVFEFISKSHNYISKAFFFKRKQVYFNFKSNGIM